MMGQQVSASHTEETAQFVYAYIIIDDTKIVLQVALRHHRLLQKAANMIRVSSFIVDIKQWLPPGSARIRGVVC